MAGIVGLTEIQHQNSTSAATVDASGNLTIKTGTTTVQGEGTATTNLQQGLAKMWVHFDGNTGNDIRDSLNISSVADNATGRYTYTYANNMNNFYYQFTNSCGGASGTTGDESYGSTGNANSSTGLTTSTIYSRSRKYDANIYDLDINSIMLHGDLA